MKSTRYLKYCFFFLSDTCDNSALVVATACYRLYCGFLFLFKLLRQLNKALQKLSMNFLNGFLSQPRVIVEPRRQHIHRNTNIHPPSALTSTKKSPLQKNAFSFHCPYESSVLQYLRQKVVFVMGTGFFTIMSSISVCVCQDLHVVLMHVFDFQSFFLMSDSEAAVRAGERTQQLDWF